MYNIEDMERLTFTELRENYKMRQHYDAIVRDLEIFREEDLRKMIPSLVEVIKALMTQNEERSNLLLAYARHLNMSTEILGKLKDRA